MMSGQISAEISHWYRQLNQENLFEVVSIDYDRQKIEIEFFDGDVEEMGFNGWKVTAPIEVQPPQPWLEISNLEQDDPAFNAYALSEAIKQAKGKLPN